MNQLNYLQELSYIYEDESVGGVAKAKAILSINNLINAIIKDDNESVSVTEDLSAMDLSQYINDIAISTIESYSTFFLDKRAESETLRQGVSEFNKVYKKTQEDLENKILYAKILDSAENEEYHDPNITYSTASYISTDCCSQSGLNECDDPIIFNVKHSGDVFVINSPQQASGVFLPNLTLNIVKGVESQFIIDTIVDGTGHPFAITGFPIGGITGPMDNGTLSMTIPVDYSGNDMIRYICTSGNAGEDGHATNEGGNINVLDPFKASVVDVRPEFTLAANTHNYIDTSYWATDVDIPCKYGGINEIKGYFNRDASCVDLSSFIYHADGLHGYQQYFPSEPNIQDTFQFRDTFFKEPFTGYSNYNYTETSTLESLDAKRYRVLIGRKSDTDVMKVYNSPGDLDYGTNSTRWPAERVDIYITGEYAGLQNIHCSSLTGVHITDEYNTKLCESSGASYRNISLVDIRSNFYTVGTTFQSDYGALQMEYSKTMVSAFSHGVTGPIRMFLDGDLDPIFISSSPNVPSDGSVTVGSRARAGLTTYDGYITSLIVENREWDHSAGHAYLKTNLNATQKAKGAFKIIDVDEIGRNDPEFGAVDWFMGSAVVIPGKITALGGMSFFGGTSATFRCPGYYPGEDGVPPAAFTNCVGQLEDLYPSCDAEGPSFALDSSHITFLPNSFAPGTSISDIQPLMRIQGPYMPAGAIVESVHTNGADNCGPYIKMNIHLVDQRLLYPESAIFNDRKYFNYKFFNANMLNEDNNLDIKYPLRCNKAVLYAYGINTPQGVITFFIAFEYYESWIGLGGNRVIYPRYKINTLWPSQSYGRTGWTTSGWNPLYRPVSLSAVETKRAQTCHMVQDQATNEYAPSVSDRDCLGLYPYNDFNTIDCPGAPNGFDCFGAGYNFFDPCGACQSFNTNNGPSGKASDGPCLAEDILDYEGNNLYNGFTLIDTALVPAWNGTINSRFLEPQDSEDDAINANSDDAPHVRGGGSGGAFVTSTDDEGNPVITFQERSRPGPDNDKGRFPAVSYSGPVNPVSDLIQRTHMTRMPKTVGGYHEDFSGFASPHPDASARDAPTSNDPFYVYTSDGFVNFLVTLAGEVGIIEHQLLKPPVNALDHTSGSCSKTYPGPFINAEILSQSQYGFIQGVDDVLYSYGYRALTAEEAEEAKVCHTETVPLSLGYITATTTLNNLHINVGMDHTPLTSGNNTDTNKNSFPDLWTPKYINGVVDYIGTAGNLRPPQIDVSGTIITNKLVLHHQQSTKDFDTVSELSLIGAVSSFFDDSQLDGYILKEKKQYHVNHNIGSFAVGGPYNDCGASSVDGPGSNYYCYNAPEKVLNDGECVKSFPGPKSFDRYLLADPWEDYLSIWAGRRCCDQNPGCACPDGDYDSFGFAEQWTHTNTGGSMAPGYAYGHIYDALKLQTAKKYGHDTTASFGFRVTLYRPQFDSRSDNCATYTVGDAGTSIAYRGQNLAPGAPDFGDGITDGAGSILQVPYLADFGKVPALAQGIQNGGAYTIDNERVLNGVNLELIDCCYLPADTYCPVWYYGFFNDGFPIFNDTENNGDYDGRAYYVTADGKDGYNWKGTVNGTSYDVTPQYGNGDGFWDGNFNGEVQFYASKKDDGKHSIFVRFFLRAGALNGAFLSVGDVVCHEASSAPAGVTSFGQNDCLGPGDATKCYTVTSENLGLLGSATVYNSVDDLPDPLSNGTYYVGSDCNKYNPNGPNGGLESCLNVPIGFTAHEEWGPWTEMPCNEQGNKISVGMTSAGFDGFIYLVGDCYLSFLAEGEDGSNCNAMNSNCLMGPKKVYP